jgi:hypothetical protein
MSKDFKLPKESIVDRYVAKNKFYEKANLNSKIQKQFVDKIKKITWKYKIAENTVGISKTENVTEIQIFEIELKEPVIPKKLLHIIDKSIPYQILYRFTYNQDIAYGITLKDNRTVENYYFSEWNEDIDFDFTGIDLEKVYQKLVKAFISNTAQKEKTFKEAISIDKKIKELKKDINQLEKKIKKEKHFNKKVEYNKVLLKKKEKLKDLLGKK